MRLERGSGGLGARKRIGGGLNTLKSPSMVKWRGKRRRQATYQYLSTCPVSAVGQSNECTGKKAKKNLNNLALVKKEM